MDRIRITSESYRELMDTVGTLPAESGAVIGVEAVDPALITRVWFDRSAGSGCRYYTPSSAEIEKTVAGWQREGACFAGIVHSHGREHPGTLSPMDLRSGELLMAANSMPSILLGLFHGQTLSVFRLTAAPEGARSVLEPLSVIVISAD